MDTRTNATSTAGTRAAAYLRLSRESEDSTSIERQRLAAAELARARGWELTDDRVYVDTRSGWAPGTRPGWDALLDEVHAGRVDVLIAWKLDRLTRRGIGALLGIVDDLRAHGTALVFVSEPIDLTHPAADLILSMLAWVAQMEAQRTSERQRDAARHLRSFGSHWGSAPYGWRTVPRADGAPGRRLVLDLDEAPRLRAGIERVVAGAPLVTVADDLGMTSTSLGKLLRSPVLRGYATTGPDRTVLLDDEARPLAPNEPLVTAVEWGRLQDALEARALGPRRSPVSTLLSGTLRCGLCSGPMVGTSAGTNAAYQCSAAAHSSRARGGCPGVVVRRSIADEFVTSRVVSTLARERVALALVQSLAEEDAAADAHASAAGERVAAIEQALDGLDADRDAGTFDTPAGIERYRDRYRQLLDALDLAQAEVTSRTVAVSAPPLAAEVGRLVSDWDGLPLLDRRRLIALAVDRVEVAPTTRGGTAAVQLARAWGRLSIVWTPLAAEALAADDVDVLADEGPTGLDLAEDPDAEG